MSNSETLDWQTEEKRLLFNEIERLKGEMNRLRHGLEGCREVLIETTRYDGPSNEQLLMYAHEAQMLLREIPKQ